MDTIRQASKRSRHVWAAGINVSPLEGIAFAVSVVAVWLTANGSLWNFPLSLISVALYAVIFYRIRLYADVILQCIFAIALLYALIQWLHGRNQKGDILVAHLTVTGLLLSGASAAVISLLSGYILASYTDASLPWIDSSLFAVSLIGTVWTAQRFIEQWYVWIAVDGFYSIVYVYKSLYLTAVLYALFIGLAIYGLSKWSRARALQLRPNSLNEITTHQR